MDAAWGTSRGEGWDRPGGGGGAPIRQGVTTTAGAASRGCTKFSAVRTLPSAWASRSEAVMLFVTGGTGSTARQEQPDQDRQLALSAERAGVEEAGALSHDTLP